MLLIFLRGFIAPNYSFNGRLGWPASRPSATLARYASFFEYFMRFKTPTADSVPASLSACLLRRPSWLAEAVRRSVRFPGRSVGRSVVRPVGQLAGLYRRSMQTLPSSVPSKSWSISLAILARWARPVGRSVVLPHSCLNVLSGLSLPASIFASAFSRVANYVKE